MKKNALRIVFMGTPEFAVGTLKLLVEYNYDIVGVITAPDKPAGRGQKLHQSDVKKYALSQDLRLLQPTNLKDEGFLTELKSLEANVHIVVAFRMLPEAVWKMPKYGTFNLHASLLPDYRGAAPIHWAVINGEEKTGVTTFFIDDRIDTGAIILQKEVAIKDDETVGTLHDTLQNIGSELVIETLKLIENGEVKTTIQPKVEQPKTAYKLNKDNCQIDWSQNLDQIYNKIRGLNPFPAAWSHLKTDSDILMVKIFEVEKEKIEPSESVGTLIATKNNLKVATKDGYLLIKEIQLPGKKKMEIKSLLNGYSFNEGDKML
ncbi:methionyl-tRNA formyltransferase [Gelidibacter salicanalis]|uniref:Methionyl-tRNA formyltransferase n=1 Tax=Gelidibacter salicanalis TaxID=291193 RepID=A0A934KMJ6_9FLAO|nr:methionyl-tRNA formyltransferase [Gelidibacter salicanalis]MBJ7880014.1 methionyl-tRNA formyltransferase [Gelidibacter salicanalis]